MATTTHLGITLLEQAQAQKEVTVNEALIRIDVLLNSGAIDKDLATPPGSPAQGDVYIVAASPTGAWAGQAKAIAYFDQLWRFITPNAGATLWVNDESARYVFNGTAWTIIATGGVGDMVKATYDPANIGQQLVGTTAAQTLTNKTLTAPVIATISNSGTLTLPTSTDTLVGRATTDTLTNKTLSAGSNTISGLTTATLSTANPPHGFTEPVNLQLNASVASNLLTIAVKGNNGSDASASNPVLIPFRDSTIANGGPVWVALTSALSISTNATGATLGSSNSTAFRLWIVAFNNAGTVVLALVNCSNATQIFPLFESAVASTTGISGSATSAGVFYTPNGTTLTSKSYRILGYVDYSSGLTTAGTYATAPDIVQLFGPGVRKPGDVIQTAYATNSGTTTGSGTTQVQTGTTASLTPTSKVNLILAKANGVLGVATSAFGAAQLSRGSTPTLIGNTHQNSANGSVSIASLMALDKPQTTSAQAYYVYIVGATGFNGLWNTNGQQTNIASIVLQELMG